ncbi:MAG: NUDIX domain-containing protein [Methylocystis sp.]|nr:NUDIX domain-containing protein [Methylocystis sp.]
MSIVAAGVLFVDPQGRVLLLKRADSGEWACPGGGIEPSETPAQAALRECDEEMGEGRHPFEPSAAIDGPIAVTNIPDGSGQFATFLCRAGSAFVPALNDEHTDAAWVPPEDAPEPVHPGVKVVLKAAARKIAAPDVGQIQQDFDESAEKAHIRTEIDVARAIAAGDLPSPQPLANSALFDLRITGTGAAYRAGINEYVWRDPSICLNEGFLARCNGLPVIWEHPASGALNSDEFGKRAVGTIILPHIRGDEVWGVARIFDANAIDGLQSGALSTSPGVVFAKGQNETAALDGGETVLIEEAPALLDHLAICGTKSDDPSAGSGVWDKGGPPAGVRLDSTETMMEDEDRKEEATAAEVKSDAAAPEDATQPEIDPIMAKLDAIAGLCDSLSRRMDAIEAAGAGAEKTNELNENPIIAAQNPVEPSRADSEEPVKEDVRADSIELAKLREEISRLQRQIAPRAPSDEAELAEIQARADSVYMKHGERAKPPMLGETATAYRLRLARDLKRFSKNWRDVQIGFLAADPKSFDVVEAQVYADAVAAASDPSFLPDGGLVAITEVDPYTGQRCIHYKGKEVFLKNMDPPVRMIKSFNRNKDA